MNGAPRSLPEVLRDSAARFGDQPALIWAASALTYAELADCVETLAARMLAAGAEPGCRVGLSVESGPLAVLSSAALMRLSCAYVPLDPSHPVERLRHIVADSGIQLAVCDAAGRQTLADAPLGLLEVCGDDLVPRRAAADVRGPAPATDAYVMYTSGSTGLPKGVAISHANLISLLADAVPLFSFGTEVWPIQHGYGFDVSVWEIWAGIATGTTLIAAGHDTHGDPEKLAELLLRHGVTRLHIVPSVFAQLAEVIEEEGLRVPLRAVTFSGEPINYRALHTWAGAQPDIPAPTWYNVYGITESTIYNTFKEITQHDLTAVAHGTPIGVGYPRSPVVVLDEEFRRVPPGRDGEIFVGGAQIARGYLNNPELSTQRFLDLPDRGGRWYRSGDFGYADDSGCLHYLGRRDHQVKIRGFRIELAELEHAAQALAWVTDAAATTGNSSRGELELALFLITADDVPDLFQRAREDLGRVLPSHMMPSKVVRVARLPQNANGKLDRRALAALLWPPPR